MIKKMIQALAKHKIVTILIVCVIVAVGVFSYTEGWPDDAPTGTLTMVIKEATTGDTMEVEIPIEEMQSSLSIQKPTFHPLASYTAETQALNPTGSYIIEFYFDLGFTLEDPGDIDTLDHLNIWMTGNKDGIPVDTVIGPGDYVNDAGEHPQIVREADVPISQNVQIAFTEANGEAFSQTIGNQGTPIEDYALLGLNIDGSGFTFGIEARVSNSQATINGDIIVNVDDVGALSVTINSLSATATAEGE